MRAILLYSCEHQSFPLQRAGSDRAEDGRASEEEHRPGTVVAPVHDEPGDERAVDDEKRRFLERSARDYARRAGVDWERVRFDIVSVVFSHPVRLEFFADAFEPRRTL